MSFNRHRRGSAIERRTISTTLMEKTTLPALLKKHGVELPDDASEETILAALDKIAAADPTDLQSRIAQLEAEKTELVAAMRAGKLDPELEAEVSARMQLGLDYEDAIDCGKRF